MRQAPSSARWLRSRSTKSERRLLRVKTRPPVYRQYVSFQASDILRGKIINPSHLSPALDVSKEARRPGSAGRVFVDQAARDTLSATLTPRTAASGAEGER
jgi:hypothetical protein